VWHSPVVVQQPEHVDGSHVEATHCCVFGSHVLPAPLVVQSVQVFASFPHAVGLVPSSQKSPAVVVRQQPFGHDP
jgi:hypothetical protein